MLQRGDEILNYAEHETISFSPWAEACSSVGGLQNGGENVRVSGIAAR